MSKTRKDYSPRRREPREESFKQHSVSTHLRPMISGNLGQLDPEDLDTLDEFADEFPSFEKSNPCSTTGLSVSAF